MTAGDAQTFPATGPADLAALLDRLEATAAAATPGPWKIGDDDEVADSADWFVAATGSPPDAALIVAEHNALPTLVAELRRHQAAVQAVRELIEKAERNASDLLGLSGVFRIAANVSSADLRAAVAALDPKEQD